MKSFFTKNNIPHLTLIGVIILITFYLFFNESGLISYYSLRGELNEIRAKVDSSKARIVELESEIDSLKDVRFKIEKVAREKYNLKKKGEKVFKIKEQ